MNKQRGAIVVEATLSLTIFIFSIFTILNIVNMCFVQAKIAVALNTAAKEISQYSYLYYALGVDNLESQFHQGTGDSRAMANETVNGIGTFIDAFGDAKDGLQDLDLDKTFNAAETGMNTAQSLTTMYSDAISEDPKGFIMGMAKMATDELGQEAKKLLGQTMAKAFMKQNLMSSPSDNPDAFLKRHDVVGGMSGLDFNYTTLMAYGESRDIQLVVTYDIRMLQLLNIDFSFKIRQCSKTVAWGNGVSILNKADETISAGENVWDLENTALRGQKIVAAEKDKYSYTSSGLGYDAYNNTGNANEFVTITTADTTMQTYQTESGIRSKLLAERRKLENGPAELGETLTVTNNKGEKVTVKSDPGTRTYKIVLVVPDNAVDAQYVKQAVADFQKDYPGYTVVVQGGYGNPTPESEQAPK